MNTTTSRRKRLGKTAVVVRPGDGGGGLLLLGGALAATAALGLAFVFRAASRKKETTRKGSLREVEEEKKGSTTPCSRECGGKEVEDREGLRSLPPTSPPPLPQGGEGSSFRRKEAPIDQKAAAASESGADESSSIVKQDTVVKRSEHVQAQEKTVDECSSIGGGPEEEEDLLPPIVNNEEESSSNFADDSSSKHEQSSIHHNPPAASEAGGNGFSAKVKNEDLIVGSSSFVPLQEKITEESSSMGDVLEEQGVLLPASVKKEEETCLSYILEEGDGSSSQNPAAVSESGASDSSAAVNEDASVERSDSVQVQEKTMKESSSIGGCQEVHEDLFLVNVNEEEEGSSNFLHGGEDPSFRHAQILTQRSPDAVPESCPADSSTTVNDDVIHGRSHFVVPVEEKIIKESSSIQGGQNEEGEDLHPVVNKKDEGEDSSSKHEQAPADQKPTALSQSRPKEVNEDAIVGRFDFAPAQERIIEESSSTGGGKEEEEDFLPVIVNKDVVVDETKDIQVVDKVHSGEGTAFPDGSAKEEEEEEKESPAEESTEESLGGEADPAEVVWPAKAMESTKPLLGLIQRHKAKAVAAEEKVFHGDSEKLGSKEAETPCKEKRLRVLDRMAVEMKEKGLSRIAQVLLVLSTLLFTTMLAFWLHHYSSKAP